MIRKAAVTMLIVLLGYLTGGAKDVMQSSGIRPPAVSGQFYPSDSDKLERVVRQFLNDAKPITMEDPVAMIVPHAGYIYSGQICADAYRQIMNRDYDVFVILGVNHTAAGFQGVSLADYKSFRTPLGDVPVDTSLVAELAESCSDCVLDRTVHAKEHSIEVQLPFIQVLFPDARIVPAIVHPPDFDLCARFGNALADVLKNRKALIIISSDLSHYPPANEARLADRKTLSTIAGMDPKKIVSVLQETDVPGLETRACGEAGILSGITASKILGARRTIVASYTNSGEISVGTRSRSVGYGSVLLTPGTAPNDTEALQPPVPPTTATPLTDKEKRILLEFARKTLRQYLSIQTVPLARNFPARLSFKQGAFVTLEIDGQLRGCVGNLLPDEALAGTVGRMVIEAARNDPRFLPVAFEELDKIEIEISVLTPMKTVDGSKNIVPGRDGVLLIKDGTSAVFLPQVATEYNWDTTEMLEHLCTKAGLPAGCWKKNAEFRTFQADVFNEKQLPGMDPVSVNDRSPALWSSP